MKLPKSAIHFPIPAKFLSDDNPAGKEKVVFGAAPDKEMKKFLSVVGVEFVVKELREDAGKRELLVCGTPVVSRIETVLSQLAPGSAMEYLIPKPDFSQQLWIGAELLVRGVFSQEDLVAELKLRQPPLCIVEHSIPIRAAMEKYMDLKEEADKAKKPFVYDYQAGKLESTALELLPQLAELSPATRFVITRHHKGGGISQDEREQYEKIKAVDKVVAWIDSSTGQKYLVKLIRRLYP